jgi:hypothetical protein
LQQSLTSLLLWWCLLLALLWWCLLLALLLHPCLSQQTHARLLLLLPG